MTSTSSPVAVTTEVIGHFDYVLDGRAYGWALARANPQKRLVIEIIADGEVVAHGRAEQFREDLKDAGIGDGFCMFDLQLSHELFDGEVHSLIARIAETGTVLNGGNHEFGPEKRELAYPQIPRALGLKLLAEQLSDARYRRFSNKLENFSNAYRLASRLQETGQPQEARSAWATINNALGENSLGYCKLGECLMLEGLPADALEAFRVAAGIDLRLHWAHLGVANSHYSLGQFEEAEEALQVAIALQPEDTSLRERLYRIQHEALPKRVQALLDQQERDKAIDLLKSVLLRQPDNNQAAALLGDLIYEMDETDLPGMAQLNDFRKAQRVLEALLESVESRLNEVVA
ncbi:tetratricopeptide repeat protein [Pseudomonas capeferrum]|uniref:tetratricopeptide repeat protein n=1 Tax=Pseudomonas capeferrum TaxID=1495066 RepID=UPI0015E29B37|nr:tetratricopeptide repeat protein [Pseudomonas capeferrum]MBA1204440.1 tetratricopeptide repeat protein [Pseudomonas capeferrum]